MTADGKAPAAGQLHHNPDLAATFRQLAEHGAAKGAHGSGIESMLQASPNRSTRIVLQSPFCFIGNFGTSSNWQFVNA